MIAPGINMEFIRCEDKPFEAGVARAAKMGYRFVEPMVHNGRELLSEAGYFHSISLDEDPLFIKDICDRYRVRCSGLSAHCPLMRPEISVPYLEKRYASQKRWARPWSTRTKASAPHGWAATNASTSCAIP